jgi:alkanesulfonate monooxygenase SsuD/methylene tetrahydromethanopterin reductase-like flavin-dependent oxidoreductase (luciferase family)
MRVYHFTEHPYPQGFDDPHGYMRVDLPNRVLDPKIAADLYHRYYDEFLLADELGLDVMVNEHHQTTTCLSSTAVVALSVLARQTKRARILVLGYPIGHRPDPLRVAEELSTIDVISRGRLDMGFIKGVPYEFAPSNANPVGVMDRFWDAHDFIIKAMTSHDAPFNWESDFFHYRQVNIWPRPWQQPHPPVWSTTASKTNARVLGERGYVMAVLGSGYNTRSLYDAYREGYASTHNGAQPGSDRFAYLALFAIAHDETEARRRGEQVADYLRTGGIVYPPFKNPPGYLSVDDTARIMRGMTPERSFTKDGRVIDMRSGSVQDLIDSVLMFCGTPDQVYRQITDFIDYTGGLGNLLIMAQGGHLNHADTCDQLTLMAKEVMPRLKEYKQPAPAAKTAAA